MKKTALALLAGALLSLPAFAAADSDLKITTDGTVTAKNIVVYQKATRNFFTRAIWGNAFIRMTIVTNDSTKITKKHGEPATAADIQEKDVLDVEGRLNVGGDSITIQATSIRDASLTNAGKTLTGTVKSVNAGENSFVLNNKTFGDTRVYLQKGATITKGARTIDIGELKAGDKVLSASGEYQYEGNALMTDSVVVYQDKSVFTSRNFEGTLKSIASTQLPTTVVVAVGSQEYTVALPKDAKILSSARRPASLSRFVIGDTVRFYGKIRETDFSQVDAEILRDLNF